MEPTSNPLVEFVERIRARPDQVYDWQPVIEPPNFMERRLEPCPPPVSRAADPQPADNMDAARRLMRARIRAYLEIDVPDHMLLVKALPGTGKTTAAVEIVDELAAAGRRIAYAGPRHDLYAGIIAKSGGAGRWYEWLPRQAGDPETGSPQTCRYSSQINDWLGKGYAAIDFCSGVCGWDYVNQTCPYYQQKNRPERVIYVQHQHVSLGHPLEFTVLFGDESPLQAFTHEWRIPARWVLPPGMDPAEPLTEILLHLSIICQNVEKGAVQGPPLLECLGGAAAVLEACQVFTLPASALALGEIHRAEQVADTPYFHLPHTVALLEREARQALENRPYPQRVIASAGHLTLLLRRTPRSLPPHVIWLDATGRPELYKQVFGRRVEVVDAAPRLFGRIYQVVDRANGKHSLLGTESKPTHRAGQARQVVERIIADHGYTRPTVITYKGLTAQMDGLAAVSHFYAARGTNEHEDADAVIILGSPQSNLYEVVKTAKMLYFERDEAFDVRWTSRPSVYRYVAPDGLGRSYPVSGFHHDPALQVVLETIREDEILQAAHRGRPVNHPVDIWLLTNIPIDALPPDELLTMRAIMGAPERVDAFKWALVQGLMASQDVITVADIEALGISRKTAGEYLDLVTRQPGWNLAAVKTGQRGQPPKSARRISRNDILRESL